MRIDFRRIVIDWPRIGLICLSGILSVLIFPSIHLEILAWVAFIPLLAALQGQSLKNSFWIGWSTGLIHFFGTLYWVTVAMAVYGHLPKSISAGLLVIQVMYIALYFGAFAMLVQYLGKHACIPLIVSAPVVWTALEYARTYFLLGFPWNLLGYSQHLTPVVIQAADITGVYGISFLVMLVNAGLYSCFFSEQVRKESRITHVPFVTCADEHPILRTGANGDVCCTRETLITAVITAGCLGLCVIYGVSTVSEFERTADTRETVRVAVVQGNIDQGQKWDTNFKQHILDTYIRLSAATLVEQPDLIIWPETAAPFVFKYDPLYREQLVEAVKSWNTPLLFGVTDIMIVPPPQQYNSLNSAFLLSARGELVAQYDKIHLVPFGEYVPFKKVLFFVEKMVTAIGEIIPGQEYTVMPFQDTPFSSVICFEIIFPNLVRKFVDNGAQFLVTITNDAWYGRTAAPYQHFAMTTFRAVENRSAIARSANTGISGFIDPVGRIMEQSELLVEDWLVADIPMRTTTTFYTQYGDVFAVGCVLLVILGTGKAWWYSRRKNSGR